MKKPIVLTTLIVLLGSGLAFAGTTDPAPCTKSCACAEKKADSQQPAPLLNPQGMEEMQRP